MKFVHNRQIKIGTLRTRTFFAILPYTVHASNSGRIESFTYWFERITATERYTKLESKPWQLWLSLYYAKWVPIDAESYKENNNAS